MAGGEDSWSKCVGAWMDRSGEFQLYVESLDRIGFVLRVKEGQRLDEKGISVGVFYHS